MLLVECKGCGTQAFTGNGGDPDATLVCPPESDCCQEDHHHGQAANACTSGHGACPNPDNCAVWLGMQPHQENSNQRDTTTGPCPGNHCGVGVDGCTVCRPLKITFIPGGDGLVMQRAEG